MSCKSGGDGGGGGEWEMSTKRDCERGGCCGRELAPKGFFFFLVGHGAGMPILKKTSCYQQKKFPSLTTLQPPKTNFPSTFRVIDDGESFEGS